MNPGDWREVKQIFNSALDLEPGQREKYLSSICDGNAQLRERIDALLRSYCSTFLEKPLTSDGPSNGQRFAVGSLLGRFTVIGLLGAGGMGEVYLAHDNKLDRKVAIKVLGADYENKDASVTRFIREAKAASALNHPNILTIHEIGETADSNFIVSEFVEGKTLREILCERPLNLLEILDITVQTAGALAAAHAAKIIHRDIKPENVIVRDDGLVKVLDFGLAKLLKRHPSFIGREEDTVDANQTTEGLILGTVNYMSPEQARGERVDERTDIFSLGVVIYEMVAGRTPFYADSMPEVFANLINREPEPLERFSTGVPPELSSTVGKMLQKDRDERYQTMKGVLADLNGLKGSSTTDSNLERTSFPDKEELTVAMPRTTGDGTIVINARSGTRRAWYRRPIFIVAIPVLMLGILSMTWSLRRAAVGSSQPQIQSLAVLPLRSIGADDNYLGFGIADAVIRRISQTGKVVVRPTSAVRKYLSDDTDALTAARQLSADAVLEGSLQRDADRLRISVNLLRASDGMSIWSDNFDMRSADIFTIQDSVAQQVTSKLKLQLDPDQKERLNKHATSNQLAYDYYLKGIYSFDQRTWGEKAKPQAEATADLFKSAIAADPNFALAHAQLANVYGYIAILIDPKDPTWAERTQEEIARAESLDPAIAETHIARGTLLIGSRSGYQWEAGIREFLAAAQIDPNVAHTNLGDAYYHIGLEDLAVREFQRALDIDPTSKLTQTEYVLFFLNLRRYEEFDAFNRKYFPDDPPASDSFVANGRLDEAQKLLDQEMKNYSDNPWTHAEYAIFLGLKGDRAGAEASIQNAVTLLDRDNLTYHHMTYEIACAHAVLGQADEAMRWLRETADTGFPCYPAFQRDVFFDPIRQDPRFVQFMAEMKSLNEKYRAEFQ